MRAAKYRAREIGPADDRRPTRKASLTRKRLMTEAIFRKKTVILVDCAHCGQEARLSSRGTSFRYSRGSRPACFNSRWSDVRRMSSSFAVRVTLP